MNNIIASTILSQLGGNRFIAMTGAKEFIALEDGLQFKIGRNASKANRVQIVLNEKDLYDVRFSKFSPARLTKSYDWVDATDVPVAMYSDAHADILQNLFTKVTGMYTRL